jgi:hypothetical protein
MAMHVTGNIKVILSDKNTPESIIFSGGEFTVKGGCKAYFKTGSDYPDSAEGKDYFLIAGDTHELYRLNMHLFAYGLVPEQIQVQASSHEGVSNGTC